MVAPLRVGIAGLGTVGAEVVRQIRARADLLAARCGRELRLVGVCARSKAGKRALGLDGVHWIRDPLALAVHREVDCFVELMGGAGDPALSCVEAALTSGKSVVTANKALLARHGLRLARLAEKHGVALNFEAAAGAAIPVIRTLREGLAATTVKRVYGILNGTCNYILSRMEQEGRSFADCLKDAQRLGYAEADPSFDVDGHDTAQKLAILASLAFGGKVAQSAVHVEGISSITPEDLRAAADLGYRVKLLGVAVRTDKGIEQRVHPTMIPISSAIAQVMGVTNALTIDGEGIDPITLVGPGAGGAATACAVLSDIADVARGLRVWPFGLPVTALGDVARAPMERHEGGYYIRLMARDFPGAVAAIASRLAEEKISIESIVQRHADVAADVSMDAPVPVIPITPVILITYATHEDGVRRALAAVQRDKVIRGRPQVIRIEKN
ncbi:MAG: homoserine dehydrogenase [Alphaproteobacteria bacterium]|nr:homoserine dehydrogenase [Alphaproteobacteria bacterium]